MKLLFAIICLLLCLLVPSMASAVPIMDDPDAEELATLLFDAQEEQGICYGWNINVKDDSGGDWGGTEQGNSVTGHGQALPTDQCPKYVLLEGNIEYVSEWCECEDSAEVEIKSNFTSLDSDDLPKEEGDLLSEDADDVALFRMAEALPFLVASQSKGAIPYVPVEVQEQAIPQGDHPTGSPSSDWWRMYWWVPVLGGVGLLALLFLGGAVISSRSSSYY